MVFSYKLINDDWETNMRDVRETLDASLYLGNRNVLEQAELEQ